jgi:xanthine dehydrogenase accessory factor
MSHQLGDLLEIWHSRRDETDWVLGTVYRTEGSAYRKAGAMMLLNGFGEQFGLLSGGCLEADILRHARRAMQRGEAILLDYDSSDEDDWSYQLGIGCGGHVFIMLQPLGPNGDLDLGKMTAALAAGESGFYHQKIGSLEVRFEPGPVTADLRAGIESRGGDEWLVTPVMPKPHLLVVGGGVDARPVVAIAHELGWRISLADPRSGHASPAHFAGAGTILRRLGDELTAFLQSERVDAMVIMSHNLAIDAEALACAQSASLNYLALLGPRHRYREVLDRAGLNEGQLAVPVSAPAGFDLGARLPETIALSILAECQAVLSQGRKHSAPRIAAL